MKATYAQVIERLIASGMPEATIGDNLVAHLKSRGRLKLLPGILRELKMVRARATSVGTLLEVAHEKDKAGAMAEARELGITAEHARVNHTLIAGWRARSKSMLADRSGKRALLDLYRRISTH